MPTVQELGEFIKKTYPEYKDQDALELGRWARDNFDEYKNFTDVEKVPEKPRPKSVAAKTFSTLNDVLNYVASQSTKKVYAPLAEHLPVDEEAKTAIKKISKSKQTVMPSDVLEQLAPGVFETVPGAPLSFNVAKVLSRLGSDIALDPTTYVGIGLPTKVGRIVKAIHELQQEGKSVKLNTQLAKDIAKVMKVSKPSPAVIQKFMKTYTRVKTGSQQIAAGQRSILSVVNPITNEPIGNIDIFGQRLPTEFTGKLAGKLVKPLSLARRGEVGNKIEMMARDIFSSKSGDPDFDTLISKFRSRIEWKKGLKIADSRVMNKEAQDLMREFGLTREEFNAAVNKIGEAALPIAKKGLTKIYPKDVVDNLIVAYSDKLIDSQLALKQAQKVGNAVDIEKHAKDIVTYNSQINLLSGKYKPPPSIDPKIDKFVNEVQERNARILLREQASGVDVTPILADIRYLPHITIPEAAEAFLKYARKETPNKIPPKLSSKEFNDFLANSLSREFNEIKPEVIDGWKEVGLINGRQARALKNPNQESAIKYLNDMLKHEDITPEQFTNAVHTLSIDEVNKLAREGKIKSLGDYRGDLFETDPIKYTTIRGIRGEIAATSAEFFQEMKGRGLALAENDPAIPSNWVNVRQSELKGFRVSPEIARVLNKWDEFNTNPESLKKVLRLYDRFHNLQKVWTLAPFPAYHTLNAVGNFWNNFLAGVTNPDVYRQALWTQMRRIDPKYRGVYFTDALGNKWNTEKLNAIMEELGVIGRGQYGADVQRTLQQVMESGKWITLSSRSHVLRVGNRVGKFIEDNARAAHFIDRLRKGDTAEQAAMSVKKFLFDYSDLSQTEKRILNRVFFFYTWTRKNIPLQLHSLVTTPAKFSIPFKAKYEIEKMTPLQNPNDEKNLSNWFQENFPIRIRYNKQDKTYEYFLLNRWLPAADLVKLSHLHEIALQMTAPILKETAQQLWNYDFYFNKKIDKLANSKAPWYRKLVGVSNTEMFGKQIPSKIAHGMKVIRLLNEIDKLTKSDSDLYTKALQLATGKNYRYDPQQGMIANKLETDQDLRDIRSLYTAEARKKNPDKKELSRLRVLYEEKVKEY